MTDYEKGLYFLKQNELNKAILCFKKSARDGNVEAMNNLASLYLQQKNYKEATLWYKQAISKGNIKAANNLAVLYEMTKEYDKAIKILTAISTKEPRALCNLGEIYFNCLNNTQKAIECYTKASSLGIVDAMSSLGLIFEKNNNLVEAKAWYIQAAHDHDAKGMFYLGRLNYNLEPRDLEEAEYWLKEAVKEGNKEALLLLGKIYRYDKNDYINAFDMFEQASTFGNGEAMNELGKLYETILNNVPNALKWYRASIEAGYNEAMVSLGMFYFNQPDYYDFATARSWLTKAYQLNVIDGLVNLGYIYFYDENNKNTTKAIDYLEIASSKGALKAYKLLGTIYSSDYRLFDYKKAIDYLELALPADEMGDTYFQLANIYNANKNTGKFLEYLEKACNKNNKRALFTYGRLLCDSSFVRFDYVNGMQKLEQSSKLGCIEATKLLVKKYGDKRCQFYNQDKSSFYYKILLDQIVKESQDFDTDSVIADLPREDLISIAIALINRIGKKNLY